MDADLYEESREAAESLMTDAIFWIRHQAPRPAMTDDAATETQQNAPSQTVLGPEDPDVDDFLRDFLPSINAFMAQDYVFTLLRSPLLAFAYRNTEAWSADDHRSFFQEFSYSLDENYFNWVMHRWSEQSKKWKQSEFRGKKLTLAHYFFRAVDNDPWKKIRDEIQKSLRKALWQLWSGEPMNGGGAFAIPHAFQRWVLKRENLDLPYEQAKLVRMLSQAREIGYRTAWLYPARQYIDERDGQWVTTEHKVRQLCGELDVLAASLIDVADDLVDIVIAGLRDTENLPPVLGTPKVQRGLEDDYTLPEYTKSSEGV